jgi:flagellar FliL protein
MSDHEEAPAEGEGTVAPKGGPKPVVLIGALVGSLLLGGAGGFLAVGPMVAKKSGYVVAAHTAADSAAAEGEGGAGEHGEKKEGKEGESASSLHLIDNLVLNPAGSGGSRFLMLAAAIEFNEAKDVEEIKTRDAEARDVVLRVLGARTVEDLSEMKNREAIKKELADSLGSLFGKKKKVIRRVYFPQFVIQ